MEPLQFDVARTDGQSNQRNHIHVHSPSGSARVPLTIVQQYDGDDTVQRGTTKADVGALLLSESHLQVAASEHFELRAACPGIEDNGRRNSGELEPPWTKCYCLRLWHCRLGQSAEAGNQSIERNHSCFHEHVHNTYVPGLVLKPSYGLAKRGELQPPHRTDVLEAVQ